MDSCNDTLEQPVPSNHSPYLVGERVEHALITFCVPDKETIWRFEFYFLLICL